MCVEPIFWKRVLHDTHKCKMLLTFVKQWEWMSFPQFLFAKSLVDMPFDTAWQILNMCFWSILKYSKLTCGSCDWIYFIIIISTSSLFTCCFPIDPENPSGLVESWRIPNGIRMKENLLSCWNKCLKGRSFAYSKHIVKFF